MFSLFIFFSILQLPSFADGSIGYEFSTTMKIERMEYKGAFYRMDLTSNKYLFYPDRLKLFFKKNGFETGILLNVENSDIRINKGMEDVSANLLVDQPAEMSFRREWMKVAPSIFITKQFFHGRLLSDFQIGISYEDFSKDIISSTGYINMLKAEAMYLYDRGFRLMPQIGFKYSQFEWLVPNFYITGNILGRGRQGLKLVSIDDFHGEYSVFSLDDRATPLREIIAGIDVLSCIDNFLMEG